ncbi:hypothetical protein GUITHDRAFT_113862 [Guillardia theta CCMP2712]|uniref:Uncharacterized protein n=1 Tax=Guillardia theta (strain CCMP2712) TaxID=905079 RepID=L1IV39_GUITC|nr:hypothetical protein GUITHDRAFT_113862 [Guillardia theta CCMP2712]EKX40126.1 hypothetical protein GUITHDRAFT_113862 [Guillardia theta CCMP2712]|eukprot:XP_005827106.1 hypothetical protein GUITHDRAFT_113862 [Guillardia theta CCMP2712]
MAKTPRLRRQIMLHASSASAEVRHEMAAAGSESQMQRMEDPQEMMKRISDMEDSEARMAEVRRSFHLMNEEAMQFLAGRLQEESDSSKWQNLLGDIQKLTNERLENGKKLLVDLLNSGEINVLDRRIVENVKSGEIDPAFLIVLDMNINDAQAKATDEITTNRVLGHIYTRVQEELEKRAKPSLGLLHKLLRLIDEPGIRMNLLEHNLKPKPEEEQEYVYVDGKLIKDSGALVKPEELVEAIKLYMERVRALDQVEDESNKVTEETIGQAFEDCRVIAKDARAVIESLYNEEEVEDFTSSLTPVFQPIMETLSKYRRG